jgi:L-threonylcarbamoyladenylate synthase
MRTLMFKFNEIGNEDYLQISAILRDNGIFIYPTETIYGIGGKAFNNEVVERIVKIKNRPENKNFLVLFKNYEMLEKYVFIENELEKELIEKYWPGELTIILNSKDKKHDIACRISSHTFVEKLFEYIDFPIISTSANYSGESYTGDFKKICEIFKGKIDAIVYDGDKFSKPSTIVKVINNKLQIIRQGKQILQK